MEKNIITRLQETRYFVTQKTRIQPEIGLILGSGLGSLVDQIDQDVVIPYREIPHFVAATVKGHTGELVIGKLAGRPVIAMCGRFHFYESYSMEEITYPVRLMKFLGISRLVVTSAVGAINPQFCAGEPVVITDHINFMGADALRRPHFEEFGERFPDMSDVYPKKLRDIALSCAKKNKLKVHEGVYFGVRGPTYETPAEIRAFRALGGDIVGMSVIPEAVVANQMGVKVLGVSFVSNAAAGVSQKRICHDDVVKTGKAVEKAFGKLIRDIVAAL